MPQIVRTTTGMKVVNVATLQSLINTLKNNMLVNKMVTAADINQLMSAYNSWILHTHQSTDLRGQDTFGNKAVYGAAGTYVTSTSQAVKNATAGAMAKATGNTIDAADPNTVVAKINAIRTHTHVINDITA